MLNRLPIYNRPKEPAIGISIGNPVLVETSNANLGNLPNLPTPAKYDHFGNLVSPPSGSGNSSKQLPPLPGLVDCYFELGVPEVVFSGGTVTLIANTSLRLTDTPIMEQ